VTLPAHAKAWLQQRCAAAIAVAEIEARELRELDPATALAMSEVLLAAAPIAEMASSRRDTSGFVAQQRLFTRRR
jgi:hypothetical protein